MLVATDGKEDVSAEIGELQSLGNLGLEESFVSISAEAGYLSRAGHFDTKENICSGQSGKGEYRNLENECEMESKTENGYLDSDFIWCSFEELAFQRERFS